MKAKRSPVRVRRDNLREPIAPPATVTVTLRLPADLAQWLTGKGGSEYVRHMLEAMRERETGEDW